MDNDGLWSALPLPVMLVDKKINLIDINPAAENLLNISRRSLTSSAQKVRFPGPNSIVEVINRVQREGTSVTMNEIPWPFANGIDATVRVQVAEFGCNILLTVEKSSLNPQINSQKSSQAAAKTAIGMAEMLAHEIKNPLAGISGAAQLLAMNLSGNDLEMTDLIVSETKRIVKLLDQVEDFGNLQPLEISQVNIHDVLDRVRKLAVLGFGAHIQFIDDFDPSLPLVAGNTDQLVQVFMNLVKNAAAVQPDHGKVLLRTFYDPGPRLQGSDGTKVKLPIQVEVVDFGPGVPAELQDHLFDPFVSGQENGTGLGLAIVAKIIADHRGRIRMTTKPERTVFQISLPISNEQES